MPVKSYALSTFDKDEVPLSSFFDEFGIDPSGVDVRKLVISVDLDWSGCFYAGEQPEMCVEIKYDEN